MTLSPTSPTAALGAPIPIVLVRSELIAPAVKELTFERSDGLPLTFAPGQWVNLLIPTAVGEIKRAYSIASEPNETARFQLAVTLVDSGPGSSHLHAIQPGDTLAMLGPHGLFQRRSQRPTIFVGTGTGVTPLRSMYRAALRERASEPLWLLLGVRYAEDQLYREECAQLMATHPNFRAIYTLSKPTPGWTGHHGYVQTHLRELYCEMACTPLGASASPSSRSAIVAAGHAGDFTPVPEEFADALPAVYICGLSKMVSTVRDVLRKGLGLPRGAVHSERYD
jgi:CDP-4-dehydro-6-deoxyglucose reductase, E3